MLTIEIEWRTWTFTIFAAACGWIVGVRDWPIFLLLALPLADVVGSRVERRNSVPRIKTLEHEVEVLRNQLAEADEVAANARRNANRATSGLVTAANLAVRLEEDVRALIVADLHDSVAQTLVAAAYLGMNPKTPNERLAMLAAEAEAQLREIMTSRKPLHESGASFADSMAGLVADLGLRYDLEVHVDWPEDQVMIPRAISVVLYRFAAEALTNVAKHAKVDEATVKLRFVQDAIVFEVYDEGAGFDTAQLSTTQRLGLALVARRAEMVGGTVETVSAPGEGTTLRCEVPLALAAAGA